MLYPIMDKFDFPKWLIAEREKRGWLTADLARAIKRSGGYTNNLETGERKPTDEALRAIAEGLSTVGKAVDADWLIAQVDTCRIGDERIERLRKHAPEFLGLPPAEPDLPAKFLARLKTSDDKQSAEKKARATPGAKEAQKIWAPPAAAGRKGKVSADPDHQEHSETDGNPRDEDEDDNGDGEHLDGDEFAGNS